MRLLIVLLFPILIPGLAAAKLLSKGPCVTQCGPAIAAHCTVVKKTKHGTKSHIKPACKRKLTRQCRQGKPVCTVSTTSTTLPGPTLTLTVPATGSDLDNGWTGISHNFPIINGSTISYSLSCPDHVNCTGTGTTGPNTPNGLTFGTPLPLLAANAPVCVVNRFQTDSAGNPEVLNGTFNLRTGAAGVSSPNNVSLFSDVYLRTTFPEVCPKCNVAAGGGLGSKGTCSSTAKNPGATCTVNGQVTVAGHGLYLLSSDCNVVGDSPPTTLNILLPLTTADAPPITGSKPCPDSAGPQTNDDNCAAGAACNATCTGTACVSTDARGRCIDAKGGVSQYCCANNTSLPCFPTSPASKAAGLGSITRTGSPVVPGDTNGGVFAGTFCIAHTDSSLINSVTGLPGPGALLLPAVATLTGGTP